MVAKHRSSIQGLRRANRATARLLHELAAMAKPGVTTRALDDYAMAFITSRGGIPVFATEENFPGCINTSVNDAAVHGVPTDYVLQEGDVLSIDAGMVLDGYCGDSTITVAIGEISPAHQRLIDTTRETLEIGIEAAKPGKHIGDIGYAMQLYAQSRGYGIVEEFTGHGLGRKMHEDPSVPSVGRPGEGPRIPDGLVITIEPILTERSNKVAVDTDGWTVRTLDGGWTAQFEHTVMIGRGGTTVLSEA